MTFFAISVFDICKNLLIFYCFENGSPVSTHLIVPRIKNMSTVLQKVFGIYLQFLIV
jgi:hypothetical protein